MTEREFERLIYKLKTLREDKKNLDKEIKQVEQQLKDEFNARGIESASYETIGQSLTYATVNRTDINEEALIEILVKAKLNECIQMKPSVNEEMVEDLIYKGILSTDDIAPAVIDKSYKVLKFRKLK